MCNAGTFAQSGDKLCTSCSFGSFSGFALCCMLFSPVCAAANGQSACVSCAAGFFNPNISATTCTVCSSGQYANTTGSSFCQNCVPVCVYIQLCVNLCLLGHFRTVPRKFFMCSLSSWYRNHVCSSWFWICVLTVFCCRRRLNLLSLGYRSYSSGASACSACAAGAYSTGGQSTCQPCLPGSYTLAGGRVRVLCSCEFAL